MCSWNVKFVIYKMTQDTHTHIYTYLLLLIPEKKIVFFVVACSKRELSAVNKSCNRYYCVRWKSAWMLLLSLFLLLIALFAIIDNSKFSIRFCVFAYFSLFFFEFNYIIIYGFWLFSFLFYKVFCQRWKICYKCMVLDLTENIYMVKLNTR